MLTPTIQRVAINYVPNSVPVAGSVTLSPASPTRGQTLTATPAGFQDADDDQLTYQYRWFNGDAPITGATGTTLDLTGRAARGDVIRVAVTATDGHGGTSATADASTTVANSPPVIDVSSASAAAQYSDPITSFTIRAHDDDGDKLSFTQGTATLPADLSLTDNGDGTATVSGRLNVPADTYQPNFTVSDGHGGTDTGAATITVTPESADLRYIGPLFVATATATTTSADVTLTGLLTQQDDGTPGDMAKASVDFMLYKSTNVAMTTSDRSCHARVGPGGTLDCTVTALPADNWTVVLRTTPPDTGKYFKADIGRGRPDRVPADHRQERVRRRVDRRPQLQRPAGRDFERQ